ncbi:uncharacterized protein LOC114672440 isoform X1 [Macaca mulatta]
MGSLRVPGAGTPRLGDSYLAGRSHIFLNWTPLRCRRLRFWMRKVDRPHTMVLCERARCMGRPGPLSSACQREETRGAGSSRVGEDLGQTRRCCWTSFRSPRSAGAAQRAKQTERGVVENAESWSWPEQRSPFHARSQPLCPPAAAIASRAAAGREALAPEPVQG